MEEKTNNQIVSYSCPVCGEIFLWDDEDDPNDDQECTGCDTELTFSEFVKEYEFFEEK